MNEHQMNEIAGMMLQIEGLASPLDRCVTMTLLFSGHTISLLLNGRELERFAEFKNKMIELFHEADKAFDTKYTSRFFVGKECFGDCESTEEGGSNL